MISQIINNYKVKEELGKGAFGAVYKAEKNNEMYFKYFF